MKTEPQIGRTDGALRRTWNPDTPDAQIANPETEATPQFGPHAVLDTRAAAAASTRLGSGSRERRLGATNGPFATRVLEQIAKRIGADLLGSSSFRVRAICVPCNSTSEIPDETHFWSWPMIAACCRSSSARASLSCSGSYVPAHSSWLRSGVNRVIWSARSS